MIDNWPLEPWNALPDVLLHLFQPHITPVALLHTIGAI